MSKEIKHQITGDMYIEWPPVKAKQEQGEPVGYVWQEWTKENSPYGIEQWVRKYDYFPPNSEIKQVREVTPLYTTPQPAPQGEARGLSQQKPLTDEQADKVIEQVEDMVGSTPYAWDLVPPRSLVQAILKAAHDIKENT